MNVLYYKDYARVKRMENWLEKLAYISVGLDFAIALGTLLILKGLQYSKFVLTISTYLMTAEMAIIGVLFMALVMLKHYNGIMDDFALAAFKNVKMRRASRTFVRVIVSPVTLVRKLFATSY